MKVTAIDRPFVITFQGSGHSYPVTSEEVQRLLDEYPIVRASRYRVTLQGGNSAHAYDRTVIQPSTRGGGAAFIVDGRRRTRSGRPIGWEVDQEANRAFDQGVREGQALYHRTRSGRPADGGDR